MPHRFPDGQELFSHVMSGRKRFSRTFGVPLISPTISSVSRFAPIKCEGACLREKRAVDSVSRDTKTDPLS